MSFIIYFTLYGYYHISVLIRYKIVKDKTMSESGVERELTDREVERNIGMNEWFNRLLFLLL